MATTVKPMYATRYIGRSNCYLGSETQLRDVTCFLSMATNVGHMSWACGQRAMD